MTETPPEYTAQEVRYQAVKQRFFHGPSFNGIGFWRKKWQCQWCGMKVKNKDMDTHWPARWRKGRPYCVGGFHE